MHNYTQLFTQQSIDKERKMVSKQHRGHWNRVPGMGFSAGMSYQLQHKNYDMRVKTIPLHRASIHRKLYWKVLKLGTGPSFLLNLILLRVITHTNGEVHCRKIILWVAVRDRPLLRRYIKSVNLYYNGRYRSTTHNIIFRYTKYTVNLAAIFVTLPAKIPERQDIHLHGKGKANPRRIVDPATHLALPCRYRNVWWLYIHYTTLPTHNILTSMPSSDKMVWQVVNTIQINIDRPVMYWWSTWTYGCRRV